ncbi:MAG: glycosyltransferase family 39 protein [Ignavibacteria bacterium]|nr:glycosyltransferase family 39 protein [Ignavibacteria bacterium]
MSKTFKHQPQKKNVKSQLKKNFLDLIPINFSDSKIPYIIPGIYFIVMLIISLTYHKIGDYGVETDFYEGMVYEAKEFLKGNLIIEGYKGPLYPIVLGILGFIFKDYFTLGILICVISASLFLLFSFKTIEKIYSPQIAFAVVCLMIANSVFVQYSYSAGTDLFFCASAIISIYYLVKGDQLKNSYVLLAGIFASLAYLTRTNGLFLIFSALVAFLVFKFSSKDWKKLFTQVGIYLAGFLIFTLPWSVYRYVQKGDFFYDQNFKNTAWELYGKDKMSWDYFNAVEAPKFNSMSDVFLKDPIHFIKEILFVNFYQNFVGDLEKLVSLPFAVVLVIGIIALIKQKFTKAQAFFFINILFAFLILLPAFYSERFSLFLIVGYSLIVVLFLNWEKVIQISNGKFSLALFLIIFIWSLYSTIKFNSLQIDSGPTEILAIAESVPDSLKREENLVIARKPHIGYYLNMNYRKIPFVSTYDSLMSWMKDKKADYFFVSGFEAQTLMSYTKNQLEQQKFYNLINPQAMNEGLEPITYTTYPPAVLYKVLR